MGLEGPFGVAEKTSERGYALLAFVCCLSAVQHTTRVSRGFAFLAALGVFPRSFAGVLNVSAKFLRDHQPSNVQRPLSIDRKCIHFIFIKDVCHVLVEPVEFISGGVRELINLRLSDL